MINEAYATEYGGREQKIRVENERNKKNSNKTAGKTYQKTAKTQQEHSHIYTHIQCYIAVIYIGINIIKNDKSCDKYSCFETKTSN